MKSEFQHTTELVFSLHVLCDEGIPIGRTASGHLTIIPITGGTVSGQLTGSVVPGGADWNTQRADGSFHVAAKYMIRTNSGEHIGIENEGILRPSEENAIVQTIPRFTADLDGPYAWLTQNIFAGTLAPDQTGRSVTIEVYRVK